MNNTKKVSVIVPAYNAHNTLARCLSSLLGQSLQELEIIVVNDASTDDTYEIMKRCKEQFPDKVTIINSDCNRGPGGARNQGIDVAVGEYVGFVDSDDFVSPDMFRLLYETAMEKDADIVDSGVYFEQTDAAHITTGDNVTGKLNTEKRRVLFLCGGYMTTKIFKRELFNNPKVRFREHIKCLEDNDLIRYMMLRADNIWNVKEVLYNYSDTPESATKIMDLNDYFESVYGAMEGIYDKCHLMKEYDLILEAAECVLIQWYSDGVNRCLYEQIQRYGAGETVVSDYFKGLDDDRERMLKKLAGLKQRIVSIPYDANSEIAKGISKLDIKIMKECDSIFA